MTDPNGTGASAFAGFPFDQYTVAGKTGTAEVPPKDDTAWFASYGGPAGQPAQYAVVVAISQGGQGGVTAAPAVRQIYDGIWGLNGNPKNPDDQFAAQGSGAPGRRAADRAAQVAAGQLEARPVAVGSPRIGYPQFSSSEFRQRPKFSGLRTPAARHRGTEADCRLREPNGRAKRP